MRAERETLLQEVKEYLADSDFLFAVNYTGLDVAQMGAFRAELRGLDCRLRVVKNTYLKLAAADKGWTDLSSVLVGPTAIVTGTGEVTVVAKAILQFLKQKESTAVKGGCLEGMVLSSADVDALARLPSREQMLGIFVGTVAAPMTQLVGAMHAKLCSLLYALKAVEEKKQAAA